MGRVFDQAEFLEREQFKQLVRNWEESTDAEAAFIEHERRSTTSETPQATAFGVENVAEDAGERDYYDVPEFGCVHPANGRVTDRTVVSNIRFVFGQPWPEFGALVFDVDGSPWWEALDEHGYLELASSNLYARFPSGYDGHVAEVRRALRAWMTSQSLLEFWVDGWERLRVMVEFGANGREIAQAIKDMNTRLDFETLIEPGSTVRIFACGSTPPALEQATSLLNEEIFDFRAVAPG